MTSQVFLFNLFSVSLSCGGSPSENCTYLFWWRHKYFALISWRQKNLFLFSVSLSCGGSSSENCTYLVQASATAVTSPCNYKICPTNSNICRLRFDFLVSFACLAFLACITCLSLLACLTCITSCLIHQNCLNLFQVVVTLANKIKFNSLLVSQNYTIYIIKELVLKQCSKFYASGGNVAKLRG